MFKAAFLSLRNSYHWLKTSGLSFANTVKGIPEAVVNAIKYHIKASE